MNRSMIEVRSLSKIFRTKHGTVHALNDINLSIAEGDIFGIIGMSGAGKSTLVRCMNMLERPTEGTVLFDGKDLSRLSARELRAVRWCLFSKRPVPSIPLLRRTASFCPLK